MKTRIEEQSKQIWGGALKLGREYLKCKAHFRAAYVRAARPLPRRTEVPDTLPQSAR
jgi:hypothetical protein